MPHVGRPCLTARAYGGYHKLAEWLSDEPRWKLKKKMNTPRKFIFHTCGYEYEFQPLPELHYAATLDEKIVSKRRGKKIQRKT